MSLSDIEWIQEMQAMTTTNDEQGKYGEQPKRAMHPEDYYGDRKAMMLHYDMHVSRTRRTKNSSDDAYDIALAAMEEVRDFYENEITEGRLMVVKIARRVPDSATRGMLVLACSHCRVELSRYPSANFCPGCGAKIIEA